MIIGMIKAYPIENRMTRQASTGAMTLNAATATWPHDSERHTDTTPALPRDAELLAFEAGREDHCERQVDEVTWQRGRVDLHLGARRDDPPRR
jgi:hypothetical protein